MTHPPTTPGQPENPYWPPRSGYTPPLAEPPVKPTWRDPKFWTSGPRVILTTVVVGLAVAGVLMLGGQSPLSDRTDPITVTVDSCSVTGGSLPTATVGLTIKNNSSTTRSATISIEYRDGSGARIDTDTARVRNIAPGDTARTEETTLLDAGATSGTCVITGVR